MWDLIATTSTNWLADTGSLSRVPPVDLVNTLRFYRAASKDRWRNGNAHRTATIEVYAAMPLSLHEGENMVSLAAIPEDPSLAAVLGTNRLPSGPTLAQSTVISFYGASSNGQPRGASAWLSSAGWLWSTGGVANGYALPAHEGFNIKLPPGSGTRRTVVLGRLPTQDVVRVLQPKAYNVEGFAVPVRATVSSLGLAAAGLRGHASNPNLADEIRVLDNSSGQAPYVTPKYRIWYRTSDQTYRTMSGNANAGGYIIEPSDSIIIYTRGSTGTISWTNRIPYAPPGPTLD